MFYILCTIIITGSTTLRVLDVSQNKIGDDGIAVISEALQHSSSLTNLGVVDCGLSGKGTVLYQMLQSVVLYAYVAIITYIKIGELQILINVIFIAANLSNFMTTIWSRSLTGKILMSLTNG